MVACSPASSGVLDTVPGELVLRVRGPGRESQTVRLRSAKCSIGSGSRCTLRLEARGVRPVHCVLFRGAERTVVRRWAPDTRLNGRAFVDAELCSGDQLSIGPIEIHVVTIGAESLLREPLHADLENADTGIAGPNEGLQEAAPRSDVQQREWEQKLADWESERQALQRRLRQQAEELDDRTAELARREATFQQKYAGIDQERAELAAERERLECERAQWRSQQESAEQALRAREEASRQASELHESTDQERAELAAERERLECERAQWRSQQESAEQALREREEVNAEREMELNRQAKEMQAEQEVLRVAQEQLRIARQNLKADLEKLHAEQADHASTAELQAWLAEERKAIEQERAVIEGRRVEFESERAQLDEAQGVFHQQRTAWEEEYQEKEGRLAERESALNARAAEFHSEQERNKRAEAIATQPTADSGAPADDADEEIVAEIKEEAPVALADVLRRLGKSDLLRSDDDADELLEPEEVDDTRMGRLEESEQGTHSEASDARCGGDDEVSLDEYMSQLMARVRGETKQVPASKQPPPPATEPSTPPVKIDQNRGTEVTVPSGPIERTPRASAPERTGFAAMRELANVSARSAVDQHARRQMISVRRSKRTVAITAGLAGLALLWLWATYAPTGITLLGAAASFVVALLWAIQYAIVTGRLFVGKSSRPYSHRSKEASCQDARGAEPTAPADGEPSAGEHG